MDDLPPNADGSTEAYLRLLTQHDRWLAAYVYSLVPRAADADDILQEVKRTLGDQVTTVFVRQGKYAAALVEGGPEPDIVLGSIGEFSNLDLLSLGKGLAGAAH